MIQDPEELAGPTVQLYLGGTREDGREGIIFKFDQEAARRGFRYYAKTSWGLGFDILLREADRDSAAEAIKSLRTIPGYRRSGGCTGRWYDIEPTRLKKGDREHPWIFAFYTEFQSGRDDGLDYAAFLFRNEKRSDFGILEWLGSEGYPNQAERRGLAHRVITDSDFREALLSDDPDLPRMWRRH